jgi:hypothetical protein
MIDMAIASLTSRFEPMNQRLVEGKLTTTTTTTTTKPFSPKQVGVG